MTWDEEPSTKEIPKSGADTALPLEDAWPDASMPQAMTNPKMAHPNQQMTLLRDIRFFLEG
jgi:hypothetical protein